MNNYFIDFDINNRDERKLLAEWIKIPHESRNKLVEIIKDGERLISINPINENGSTVEASVNRIINIVLERGKLGNTNIEDHKRMKDLVINSMDAELILAVSLEEFMLLGKKYI